MRKMLVIFLLDIVVCSLAACETMKGFGRDVDGTGEWVQKQLR